MRTLLLAATAALVLLVSAPRTAEAKGLVIYNTGSDILYLHDVPQAALAEMPDLAGYKVGYKYDLFGLFWLDVWRWDGEMVIYKDNEYEPIPEDALALFDAQSTPVGYRLPPGLLLLLCGGLVLIGVRFSNRRLLIGLGAGLGAGTAGLYFAGLGFTTIIPAVGAAVLLFMSLAAEKAES